MPDPGPPLGTIWMTINVEAFANSAYIDSHVGAHPFDSLATIQAYGSYDFESRVRIVGEETESLHESYLDETDNYIAWTNADECIRVFVDPAHYAKYLYPFSYGDSGTLAQYHGAGTNIFSHKLRPEDKKLLESPFVQLHIVFGADNLDALASGANGYYYPASCTTFTHVQTGTLDWWDVDNGRLRFQTTVPGYIGAISTQFALLTMYVPPTLRLLNVKKEHEWNPGVHTGWYSIDDNENYLFARPTFEAPTGLVTDIYSWPTWIGKLGLTFSTWLPPDDIVAGHVIGFVDFGLPNVESMTATLDPRYNGPTHINLPSELSVFSSRDIHGVNSIDGSNKTRDKIYYDVQDNVVQDLSLLVGPGIGEIRYAKRINGFYYMSDDRNVLWKNNRAVWSSTNIEIRGICEHDNRVMLLTTDGLGLDCHFRTLDQLMDRYVEIDKFTISDIANFSVTFTGSVPSTAIADVTTHATIAGIASKNDTIFIGINISGTFTYTDPDLVEHNYHIRDTKLVEIVRDNEFFVPCGCSTLSGGVVDLSYETDNLLVLTDGLLHKLSFDVHNRPARQVPDIFTNDTIYVDVDNYIHLLSYNNIDILYTIPPVSYINDGSNRLSVLDYTGSLDVHYRIKDSYSIEKMSGTPLITFDKSYNLPSIIYERTITKYRNINVSVNPMVTGMTNRFICLSSKHEQTQKIDVFSDSRMIQSQGNYIVGVIKDSSGHPSVGQSTMLNVYDIINSGGGYIIGAPASTSIIGLKPSTDEHGICVYYLKHNTSYHGVALLIKLTTDDTRGYALLYKGDASPPYDLFHQISSSLE